MYIDPLDATREFSEALYDPVATMICITERGLPVAGAMHFPFSRVGVPQTYWGVVGVGAGVLNHTSGTTHEPPKTTHLQPNVNIRAALERIRHGEAMNGVISRTQSHAAASEAAARRIGIGRLDRAGGAGYKIRTLLDGVNDVYINLVRKTLMHGHLPTT